MQFWDSFGLASFFVFPLSSFAALKIVKKAKCCTFSPVNVVGSFYSFFLRHPPPTVSKIRMSLTDRKWGKDSLHKIPFRCYFCIHFGLHWTPSVIYQPGSSWVSQSVIWSTTWICDVVAHVSDIHLSGRMLHCHRPHSLHIKTTQELAEDDYTVIERWANVQCHYCAGNWMWQRHDTMRWRWWCMWRGGALRRK